MDDKVLDVAMFEKYLHDKIKIGGKTGALAANSVVISRDRTKLTVSSPAELKFSKRQLKCVSFFVIYRLSLISRTQSSLHYLFLEIDFDDGWMNS